MTKFNNEQLIKYKSVGGWLAFLCFALIIGSPLRTLINLSSSYNQTFQYFEKLPSLRNLFYVDCILSVLLMVLSIRAGNALWRIESGAVEKTKKYFLNVVGYSVIGVFLPFILGLPSDVSDVVFPEIALGSLKSLIFVIIWTWYLNVSKRVKRTYASHQFNVELEDIPIEQRK
jgi:hypothetical protein